ncbi:MAG: GNAT family N-acetyltransferase [Rhizobiaceae bacterium]|nr:GNAT family N-acetyltransferase [Rhizobiaceae bacterium]
MKASPILEEVARSSAGQDRGRTDWYVPPVLVQPDRSPRRLAIYAGQSGFDLIDELQFLCDRTIEPNVFFSPPFLAPAMPRVEERDVRLAVIRDGAQSNDRVRMLLPFTVQQPPGGIGPGIMRTWAHAFGLLGTPLIDRDDPAGVLEDFLAMIGRAHLGLPKVLVLPDIKLDGAFAGLLRTLAEASALPWNIVSRVERPMLGSHLSGDDYFRKALRPHHLREFRRLRRRLEEQGKVEHTVARTPEEVRIAMETFLALEAAGWKGKGRTAMAIDRYVAAFAREAVQNLAERGMCRVHALTLDGKAIASLIVFIEAGVAYTWKTAFDEAWSAFSPGTLLMMDVTRQHLEDPNIDVTDSCAVPDHPVMSRLWSERQMIGTIVLGIRPEADRAARQVAAQLHLYDETRAIAREVKKRVRKVTRR